MYVYSKILFLVNKYLNLKKQLYICIIVLDLYLDVCTGNYKYKSNFYGFDEALSKVSKCRQYTIVY